MNTKSTVVRRDLFYRQLGFLGDRIPKEYEASLEMVEIPFGFDPHDPSEPADRRVFDVRIIKATPGKKRARVLVGCPQCGEWIPLGRIHQHEGSGVCRRKAAEFDEQDIYELTAQVSHLPPVPPPFDVNNPDPEAVWNEPSNVAEGAGLPANVGLDGETDPNYAA